MYRRAIELRPTYWAHHNSLGVFCFRRGRLDEAKKQFRQVIELRPGSDTGYSNLAAAHILAGEHAEAEPLLRAALNIDPGPQHPQQSRGRLLRDRSLRGGSARMAGERRRRGGEGHVPVESRRRLSPARPCRRGQKGVRARHRAGPGTTRGRHGQLRGTSHVLNRACRERPPATNRARMPAGP